MAADMAKFDAQFLGPLRVAGWGAAAGLLLLPLIAMQFTEEVNWTAGDFVFAAALFLIVGGAAEATVRLAKSFAYRAAVALALIAGFVTIWATGAVGIIGSEQDDSNAMFLALLLLGALGAFAVRFRAPAMAWVLGAMALGQMAIGVVALAFGLGAADPSWPMDVVLATAILTVFWLLSAGLFRMAGQGRGAGAGG